LALSDQGDRFGQPAARKELLDFLAYLQQKHHSDTPVARLGGLWADIEFDVGDADVRALRQSRGQPD